MRIIVKMDDLGVHFHSRQKEGCICIIVRPDENGHLKIQELHPKDINLKESIDSAKGISVEFIAHSSQGSKTVQSDATAKYPTVVTIGIDKLVNWIEEDLIPERKMKDSKVTMLCCEAGSDTKKYASVAEQMLRLFKKKPKFVVARKGFVFPDRIVHSHGHLATALFVISKGKFALSKNTPTNEKFIFYFCDKSNQYYKVDAHLHKLFDLLRREDIKDKKIMSILSQDLTSVSKDEFKYLVQFSLKTYKSGKIHESARALNDGDIYKPKIINGHVNAFHLRDGLNAIIAQLAKSNEHSDHNKAVIDELLSTTRDFINYRSVRNYNLQQFPKLLSILTNVVQLQNGNFSDEDVKAIKKIKENFILNVSNDTNERSKPVSLRPPSHMSAIKRITETKNKAYSNALSLLLDKVEDPFEFMASQPATRLKINEEVFSKLSIDKDRKNEILNYPENVRKAYDLLESQEFNVSFIWADVNQGHRSDIREMLPVLRVMRENIHEAKEAILSNPTNNGVKESLSRLDAKMKNALATESVFKKQNLLSAFVSNCINVISIFITKLHDEDKAKQKKGDLNIKERLRESHSELKSLIKKHK